MSWLNHFLQAHGSGSEQAIDQLQQQGLPHRRLEPWRFTDIAPLTGLTPALLKPRGAAQAVAHPAVESGVVRLMLAQNGCNFVLAPGSAQPPTGLEIESAPRGGACADSAWVFQLRDVLAGPALNLQLEPGESLRLELLLNPGEANALLTPHLQIHLADGASLELFVQLQSSENSLILFTSIIDLGNAAQLLEAQSLSGAEGAVLLSGAEVKQAPSSRYERSAFVHGWALARQEPRVQQTDGAAHTCLKDLAIADLDQIIDLHSAVRFDGPNGCLEQLQKALVDDSAHSIFNGSVQVPRLAQGTDASQLSRHMLLSNRARVDAKPELAIIADDVRCSHGATISSLADEELFYMQSRGIKREQAVALLKKGFCMQIINSMPALARSWDLLKQSS